VKSQAIDYRTKAKEYARLTVVTKSLRESRRYRKLADMYWALALREELQSPPSFTDDASRNGNVVLCPAFMRAHGECLGCWKSGERSGPS
jgi:hypothetical protein